MAQENLIHAYKHDLYSLRNLGVGEHVCSIYKEEEDFRISMLEFIIGGLNQNQKVNYIADPLSHKRVMSYLTAANIDIGPLQKKEQLNFVTMDEAFNTKQYFSPQQMIDLIKHQCDQAEKEGYSAVRTTGRVAWFSQSFADIDDLLEFEYLMNTQISPSYKFIGLCQYELTEFSAEFLNKILEVHPFCHICTEILPNQFYIPPEIYRSPHKEQEILSQRIYQVQERKKRENMVASLFKQTEELREFSYMLAHDLKEPIKNAAIMNDLVKTAYIDNLNSEAGQILSRIGQALDKAFKRLDALEDLSFITNQRKGLTNLNLCNIIQDIVTYYQQSTNSNDCTFKVDLEDDLHIKADVTHINQLFHNLIDNSLKFRKKDEPLVVSISGKKNRDNSIEIIVADNGIGFAPIYNQQIFQPFKRVESKPSASGIGLTICQRIMSKYQGEIYAQGQENVGATFTLRFPKL